MIRKLLGLLLLAFQFSSYADVSVVTYNMAQLKKRGIPLVACTDKRVDHQIKAIFEDPSSPIYAEKDFVLLIQESWTKRSFNALKKASIERSFTIYPADFKQVKKNGQLVITNLNARELKAIPFTKDKYADKGLIYTRLLLDNGQTLGVINVHTGYSDRRGFRREHREHFAELASAVAQLKSLTDYFVIGGDFNAGPDMEFKVVKYDASQVVWEEGLMTLMRAQNMRLLEPVGVTWDETNNMLVRFPPLFLRLVNKFSNGYIGWDMRDSTLDHIFVPDDAEITRHELVFNQKVPLNCGNRDGVDGLMHLSDHYGVMAVLKTH